MSITPTKKPVETQKFHRLKFPPTMVGAVEAKTLSGRLPALAMIPRRHLFAQSWWKKRNIAPKSVAG